MLEWWNEKIAFLFSMFDFAYRAEVLLVCHHTPVSALFFSKWCAFWCECVCVCVREWERERERVCICVFCVCVCTCACMCIMCVFVSEWIGRRKGKIHMGLYAIDFTALTNVFLFGTCRSLRRTWCDKRPTCVRHWTLARTSWSGATLMLCLSWNSGCQFSGHDGRRWVIVMSCPVLSSSPWCCACHETVAVLRAHWEWLSCHVTSLSPWCACFETVADSP